MLESVDVDADFMFSPNVTVFAETYMLHILVDKVYIVNILFAFLNKMNEIFCDLLLNL